MALDAATGCISGPEALLANNIADATQWVSLCSPDTGLSHVYFHSLDGPASGAEEFTEAAYLALFPYAVIGTAQQQGLEINRSATNFEQQSGSIEFFIDLIVPNSYTTDQERGRYVTNTVGEILEATGSGNFGIMDRQEQAGYLTINRIVMQEWSLASLEREVTAGNLAAQARFMAWYGTTE